MNSVPISNKINKKPRGLKLLTILIAMLLIPISPLFYVSKNQDVYADETYQTQVITKDLSYSISGSFKLFSAYNPEKCLDIQGGLTTEHEKKLIVHPRHNAVNQKFTFVAVETFGQSYVYNICATDMPNYVIDVKAAAQDNMTTIQTYQTNGTPAQKMLLKEVYNWENNQYVFVGYAFFTGNTSYQKVWTVDTSNEKYVVQYDFSTSKLWKSQVWYLEEAFQSFNYHTGGYLDSNRYSGYNADSSYQVKDNYNKGYYGSMEDWQQKENFLAVDHQTENHDITKARITQNGFTYFDSCKLDVSVIFDTFMEASKKESVGDIYSHYGVISDGSEFVNNRYCGNIGKGIIEIAYTDFEGKTNYTYYNDSINNNPTKLMFGQQSSLACNKVGQYVVRLYYKVEMYLYYCFPITGLFELQQNTIYCMNELKFAVASSSSTSEAVQTGTSDEQAKIYSSYNLKVDENNNLNVTYNGTEEFKANAQDVINYLSGAVNVSGNEEKADKINQLKNKVKTYGEYKAYFVNKSFYIDAKGNPYVRIDETSFGYSDGVRAVYFGRTNAHSTDGIYEYVSQNSYGIVKNYYIVYLQSQPNLQVFRNITYCYLDEENRIINYAMDYAFMEVVPVYPYTMITKVVYQQIAENTTNQEVEYKSNTIIYNTTDDILKLKFTIWDISGNHSEMYLYIYPANKPSINQNNLTTKSYAHNYNAFGYKVKLYDEKQSEYKDFLFSNKDTAIENLMLNILNNKNICTENEDGSYDISFNANGNLQPQHFDSNQALVSWVYTYADENICALTIKPNEYSNYVIPEKSMHYDTLYLDKDFYFTSDKAFPLFETYKVYFGYYSSDCKLIKSGVITYNGQYNYGQTMFEILADNKEENWKSGYVEFTEMNVAPNSAVNYKAKIVNDTSAIKLKYQDSSIFSNKNFNHNATINCEQFKISEIPQDAILSLTYNQQNIADYCYSNFEQNVYDEFGTYKIKVINTYGFEYELTIIVDGLGSSIQGVNNFGTTNSTVTFTTDTLNFEYYINGILQPTNNYTTIENSYVFAFEPIDVDQNIYITKDGKSFAFIVSGTNPVDLSAYYTYNNGNYSLTQVKEFQNGYNSIFELIQQAYTEVEDIPTVETLKQDENEDYDNLTTTFVRYAKSMDKAQQLVKEAQDIDNPLFKISEKYNSIMQLSQLLCNAKSQYETEIKNLEELKYEILNNLGIVIEDVETEILDDIKGLTLSQIQTLYRDYISAKKDYFVLNNTIKEVEDSIHEYISAKKNYLVEIEHFKQAPTTFDSQQLVDLNKTIYEYEKSFKSNLALLKNKINKIINLEVESNTFTKNRDYKQTKKYAELTLQEIITCEQTDFNDLIIKLQNYYFETLEKQLNQVKQQLKSYEVKLEFYNTKIQKLKTQRSNIVAKIRAYIQIMQLENDKAIYVKTLKSAYANIKQQLLSEKEKIEKLSIYSDTIVYSTTIDNLDSAINNLTQKLEKLEKE